MPEQLRLRLNSLLNFIMLRNENVTKYVLRVYCWMLISVWCVVWLEAQYAGTLFYRNSIKSIDKRWRVRTLLAYCALENNNFSYILCLCPSVGRICAYIESCVWWSHRFFHLTIKPIFYFIGVLIWRANAQRFCLCQNNQLKRENRLFFNLNFPLRHVNNLNLSTRHFAACHFLLSL